jgi:hypothetical protein
MPYLRLSLSDAYPRSVLGGLLALVLVSCAAGGAGTGGGDPTAGGGGSGAGPAAGGAGAGGDGGGFTSGGGGEGGFQGTPEVFGHSRTTIYKLNPESKAVGVVGPFVGCTNIEDIALDAQSNLFGTSDEGLFEIDKVTGDCTMVAAGEYPNSLSFVPAGTLDPDEEALVGYLDDQYVRIDIDSGNILTIGAPWNNDLVSSGDIVSVKDGPTYLTVKDAPNAPPACQDEDCLVEINPASGVIIEEFGPLGFDRVFGTAFWAGSVYGFTNDGELFEIVIENGSLTTTPIQLPDGLSFWGAGSTTSAPPVPQ